MSKQRKEFNNYKIDGEVTTIYFENRYGEIILEGQIDTEDLQRLIEFNRPWCAVWDKDIQDYYARTLEPYYEDGKRKVIGHLLHRFIMNAQKYEKVDHIEHYLHSSLNNMKSNLRLASNAENTRNKRGKHIDNTSGYRNVSWSKAKEMWGVWLQVDGVNTQMGWFNDKHEAHKYAEIWRKELYGEFAGLS